MRAALCRRTGPAADVLEIADLPDPVPGSGEVLVRIRASGVNPADVKRRAGWGGMAMGHPVIVPHCDGAGVIEAVGHLAVQMARFGGARVIATVGGPEGAAHAGAAGAEIIDRRQGDVAARVMELTGGAGVDRVVEVDFAANCAVDAAVLKPNGWVASYSSSSDPTPVLHYYAFQSKGLNLRFVQGFNLPPEARAAAHRFVADHAWALRIAIGARFPLTDIAAAHARVEAGGIGNTVVIP
jgi:NADPH:quinone reductase-like Zn-dependent oxidoreductase